MERRTALAVAVLLDGRPKYQIAAACGINPSDFSGYLSGRLVPASPARQRIAIELGVDEAELFEDSVSAK